MDTSSKAIIVAIDGSAASKRAIDLACDLAGDGRSLNVVHAVDTLSVLVPIPDGGVIDTEPVLEALMNDARALCGAALAKARERGVSATSTLLEGTAAEAILRFAADADAGMIVLGTHARTGFSRMLNGSIAQAILRSSSLPVVIAHIDDVERTGPVAVAVDGSEPARAAFRFALGSALQSGKTIQLVCVRTANERYAPPPFIPGYRREADVAGVALETSLCSGEIAEAIVSEANRLDCSMIVMGTHGRNALQRVVEPSIAYQVVEKAKVPVTVVRPQPDRAKVAGNVLR